jgi:hypothetical protein
MRTRAFRHYQHAINAGLSHSEAEKHGYHAKGRQYRQDAFKGMFIESGTVELLDAGRGNPALAGRYLCRPCKTIFARSDELAMHLVSAPPHPQDGTRSTCTDCKLRFVSTLALSDHFKRQPKHMRIGAQHGLDSPHSILSKRLDLSAELTIVKPQDDNGTCDVNKFPLEAGQDMTAGKGSESGTTYQRYLKFTFVPAIELKPEKDNEGEPEGESVSFVCAGLVASGIVIDSLSAQDPDASGRGGPYVQSGQSGGTSSSAVLVVPETSNRNSQHALQTQIGKSSLQSPAVRIIPQRDLRLPNIASERTWPSLSNSPGFLSSYVPMINIKVEDGVQEKSEEEVVELGENATDIKSETGIDGDLVCPGAASDVVAASVTRREAPTEMLSAGRIDVGQDSYTDIKMESDSEEDGSSGEEDGCSGKGLGDAVSQMTRSTPAITSPMHDHDRNRSEADVLTESGQESTDGDSGEIQDCDSGFDTQPDILLRDRQLRQFLHRCGPVRI